MEMKSSIEEERFALEQAMERFQSQATLELRLLKDHLPRDVPLERGVEILLQHRQPRRGQVPANGTTWHARV